LVDDWSAAAFHLRANQHHVISLHKNKIDLCFLFALLCCEVICALCRLLVFSSDFTSDLHNYILDFIFNEMSLEGISHALRLAARLPLVTCGIIVAN